MRERGGRVVHADISGAEPTVGLKLTPDCNLYNSRDLLFTVALTQSYTHTHTHTLGWVKACHYVLAKHTLGFKALMCVCPRVGHVEKAVWVKERAGAS